jgi:hypothetical protein
MTYDDKVGLIAHLTGEPKEFACLRQRQRHGANETLTKPKFGMMLRNLGLVNKSIEYLTVCHDIMRSWDYANVDSFF